ncbi:MAG: ABC transporter ATP-binding protein [Patescibacteria group bacterium]|jgi:putative ABC transport system ATP-binding protein
MLKTENLIKAYGEGELRLVVLKSLNLEIQDGEFVAIVGPSGAGKSTLLYQLSLLDEPTNGEVYFNNARTSETNQTQKTSLRLRQMGFVFQDYALLPELTAVENVALPLLMQGLKLKPATTEAQASLERVGLGHKTHNMPSQLSGGQQQRVSIARAIVHHPRVLFADEPTANLDTASSRKVMEAFISLNHEGQTIVMVTHEEEYALNAKRIITLKDGEVVSDERR